MAPLLAGRGTSAALAKTVLELGISNGSKDLIRAPPALLCLAESFLLPQLYGDEYNGVGVVV